MYLKHYMLTNCLTMPLRWLRMFTVYLYLFEISLFVYQIAMQNFDKTNFIA